jgi:RimJ/RimL family protein N-acetyltransferase
MSTIKGLKVILKKASIQDKKQIKLWNQDEEVSVFREINQIKTYDLNFGIYDKNSGKLIGDVGISKIDMTNNHAEIGITIGRKDLWNQGYGKDAITAAINYCFNNLLLNKVYLDVWQDNKKAIQIYQKLGFKKDGVLRQHVFENGKYHHKLIMSILKKEWKENDKN